MSINSHSVCGGEGWVTSIYVLFLAPASMPLHHIRWLKNVVRTCQTKSYLLTYFCLCKHSRNSNDVVFLFRPNRKELNFGIIIIIILVISHRL